MRSDIAKLFASAALTIGVLMIPGSALAAKPQHLNMTDAFVVDDFCGSGASINVTVSGVLNFVETESGFRTSGQIKYFYLNPANGAKVLNSVTGNLKVSVIDDGNGAFTVVGARHGSPDTFKAVPGGPISKDVGTVISYDHFDANGDYIGTDFVVHGPHPELDSGFNLFCPLMIEALGL